MDRHGWLCSLRSWLRVGRHTMRRMADELRTTANRFASSAGIVENNSHALPNLFFPDLKLSNKRDVVLVHHRDVTLGPIRFVSDSPPDADQLKDWSGRVVENGLLVQTGHATKVSYMKLASLNSWEVERWLCSANDRPELLQTLRRAYGDIAGPTVLTVVRLEC